MTQQPHTNKQTDLPTHRNVDMLTANYTFNTTTKTHSDAVESRLCARAAKHAHTSSDVTQARFALIHLRHPKCFCVPPCATLKEDFVSAPICISGYCV